SVPELIERGEARRDRLDAQLPAFRGGRREHAPQIGGGGGAPPPGRGGAGVRPPPGRRPAGRAPPATLHATPPPPPPPPPPSPRRPLSRVVKFLPRVGLERLVVEVHHRIGEAPAAILRDHRAPPEDRRGEDRDGERLSRTRRGAHSEPPISRPAPSRDAVGV